MEDQKMKKANNNISNMFATARIYCLISIVSAHLYFPGTFAAEFLSRLGTVGVIGFLVMAGYFFHPQKFKSFGDLLAKKAVSIGIPWVALGSLAWFYNIILSSQFRSVEGYLRWIFGNGTYLYYLPVLLICFIAFHKAPKPLLFAALPITVVSVLLTASGVVDSVVSFLGINHYLNIFNWIGFFALGMLLQQFDPEKLFVSLKKIRFLNIVVFLIAFVFLLCFRNVDFDYFSYIAIPYEIVGAFAIFSLSTFSLVKYRWLNKLSTLTFSIYLIHMVFIGLLDQWWGRFEITRLLSPIAIISVCFLLFGIGELLAKKMQMHKIYALLIGLRVLER